MEKLNIFVMTTNSKRNQNVGVNIPKESSKKDIREIILIIKKCLEDNFRDMEIHITPGADNFLR
jgi:hypothetical protein